jgi:hypothetical protein
MLFCHIKGTVSQSSVAYKGHCQQSFVNSRKIVNNLLSHSRDSVAIFCRISGPVSQSSTSCIKGQCHNLLSHSRDLCHSLQYCTVAFKEQCHNLLSHSRDSGLQNNVTIRAVLHLLSGSKSSVLQSHNLLYC